MIDYFRIGNIASTHGIKGEVKVFPTTDDSGRFKKWKKIYMLQGTEYIPMEIESVKYFKQFVILKFKGIDSINDVEKFRGRELYIDRNNAEPCKKNEYYIADLIGLQVFDEGDQFVGELTDVLQTGANDVYVVKMAGEKEVLLPAIKQCILDISMEERKMKIHKMDGLFD
ncbi:MAG: ribosome maturation factor RimM [Lachnospiraceae bacterium]|nr:ribosome maturation factor RimM [Lachnospiraceae bacterium]